MSNELEVGNDGRDVIVNHQDIKTDSKGVGHIRFSPFEARHLADVLLRHASMIDGQSNDTYVTRLLKLALVAIWWQCDGSTADHMQHLCSCEERSKILTLCGIPIPDENGPPVTVDDLEKFSKVPQ